MSLNLKFFPYVKAWEAFASKGAPLCIAGKSTPKYPEGLSVSLYFSGKGRLKGVTVWNGDTDRLEAVVGQVPAEARESAEAL